VISSTKRARAALAAAIQARRELLDAEERFGEAMWAARSAGVPVRELAGELRWGP
jgi:hypothetical protein